jgi:hypothetical protein
MLYDSKIQFHRQSYKYKHSREDLISWKKNFIKALICKQLEKKWQRRTVQTKA